MGCSISREHRLDRRRTTESSVKEEKHFPKNNGRDDFCQSGAASASLPPLHAKHIPTTTPSSPLPSVHDHRRQRRRIYVQIPETESPVNQRNIIGRKNDDHQNNGKTNDKVDGAEDERIYISKSNKIGAAGSLFVGSPSFREYCVADCRELNADIGNKHSKEGEETTRRVPASSNEESSGTSAPNKTRVRRSKKESRPIRRHAALGSLINLASCYHPNHDKNKNKTNNNVSVFPS